MESNYGLFYKKMRGKTVKQKERAKVRECFRNGEKVSEITLKFGLHFRTVYRILIETQQKEKKRGPPIKLSGRTKQKLLALFCENPTISAPKAAKILGLSISERTVQRELQKAAFTCIRVKKRPGLTKKHKED